MIRRFSKQFGQSAEIWHDAATIFYLFGQSMAGTYFNQTDIVLDAPIVHSSLAADISPFLLSQAQDQQPGSESRRPRRGSVTSGSYSSFSELESIQQQQLRSWRSTDLASLHRDTPMVSLTHTEFASTQAIDGRIGFSIGDSASSCASMCPSASALISASFSLSSAISLPPDFGVAPLFAAGFCTGPARKRQRIDAPMVLPASPPLEEYSLGSGNPDCGRSARWP